MPKNHTSNRGVSRRSPSFEEVLRAGLMTTPGSSDANPIGDNTNGSSQTDADRNEDAGRSGSPYLNEQEPDPDARTGGRKLSSEARAEISRRNGRLSKGPITPEGKAASSANSFRHGGYALNGAYMRSGPLSEDPNLVKDYEDGIVTALDPPNDAAAAAARRLARAFMAQNRLDTYEDAALTASADIWDQDLAFLSPLGRNPVFDHALVVLERIVTPDAYITTTPLAQIAPEYPHISWASLALHVISALDPNHPLNSEDGAANPDDDEWKTALLAALDNHFATPADALTWIRQRAHYFGLTVINASAAGIAAGRGLKILDTTSNVGVRLDSRVRSALHTYQMLSKTLLRKEVHLTSSADSVTRNEPKSPAKVSVKPSPLSP
jgi:hypothetical protein